MNDDLKVGHYATHPDVGDDVGYSMGVKINPNLCSVCGKENCEHHAKEVPHFQWPAVVTPQLRFVRRNGVKILQQMWVRGPESYWEDVPLENETL